MEEKFNNLERKDENFVIEYLRKYYKISEYKELFIVNNVEDFVEVLKRYCISKNKENSSYVFRGLSKFEEKYCKITRKYYLRTRNESIDDYIKGYFNNEILDLRKFEKRAGYLLQNYDMPVDLVATAQHYGLKTRLIDWTSSLLIATLFSLHGDLGGSKENGLEEKGYYLVFVANKNDHVSIHNLTTGNSEVDRIDMYSNRYIVYEKMVLELIDVYKKRKKNHERVKRYFNNILAQTHTYGSLLNYCVDEVKKIEFENSMVSLCNKMVERFVEDKIVFLETNFTNERIVSQCGLFQIVIDLSKKYMDNILKSVEIIAISKDARGSIKCFCERLGINIYRLMPDLEKVALSINNPFYS